MCFSHCWLRLVCDFRIPRIFTNANTKSRPVTRPKFRSIQLPIRTRYRSTSNILSTFFFFFCKCRNVQEECPLLLDIFTIEDEAAELLGNVGIQLLIDAATHP